MAEALLKLRVGTAIFVDSCGLKRARGLDDEEGDAPARADPFAQAVMAEVGYDLAGHRAKTFDELDDHSFDLVISLTPEAQHRSVELTRGRAADIEYWPTFDTTLAEGRSEEHTSEIQSIMRISYADFCLNKKKTSHYYQNKYK